MIGPEDPRRLLESLQQRARRRFGQHFLARPDLVGRMVRAAGVQAGDRVLEIGPGLGILTRGLLDVGAQVTAVELDRDLAAHIREAFPEVQLIEADATELDLAATCPGGDWKLVANLPYNVGTTLLMNALRSTGTFRTVTVMLQREVVHRLVATPRTKAYGALSVEAQVRGAGRMVIDVPPSSFVPPPKVHSGVVRFDPFDAPKVGEVTPEIFDRVVQAAFSQRRKQLHNSLAPLYGRERAAEALAACGISPTARAEELDPEQFRTLSGVLHPR